MEIYSEFTKIFAIAPKICQNFRCDKFSMNDLTNFQQLNGLGDGREGGLSQEVLGN
jgi:hypothetical protein